MAPDMVYVKKQIPISQKNYMNDRFYFIRILNPIRHKILLKNIDIFTKIDIYSDLI